MCRRVLLQSEYSGFRQRMRYRGACPYQTYHRLIQGERLKTNYHSSNNNIEHHLFIDACKIPIFYDNIENYRRFLREREIYLFNDTFIDPYGSYFGQHLETRTFIEYENFIYKCYSRNLHLYQSGSKLETREINFNGVLLFEFIKLNPHRIELFDPPGNPQVFLGIHSPFIPINPVFKGHAIRSHYYYEVEVKLEREEHMLPPPYQTNCQDNGNSKDAKNFTNPNSYEVCLEMCESEFYKALYNCDLSTTMHLSPNDFCLQGLGRPKSFEHERELMERRDSCSQNCRPRCLKLHYNYNIKENKYQFQRKDGVGESHIDIKIRNSEITSIRHVPLYGSGAMFSHIGGLLGYWLGISVFTLLDIIEKCFRKAIIWRNRFKKHRA
ncbi:hypothetical protein AVEN_25386-1 [Araneus ventricosus]|uniref:Uncharacterized protein n=1 Tax=Araneus ventricosus TaxID=182803 RepID=A0A4Y2EHN9_ARAVE|nr:hypothetical protein AVEN_25386-1 [Araneus ventricosus]